MYHVNKKSMNNNLKRDDSILFFGFCRDTINYKSTTIQ